MSRAGISSYQERQRLHLRWCVFARLLLLLIECCELVHGKGGGSSGGGSSGGGSRGGGSSSHGSTGYHGSRNSCDPDSGEGCKMVDWIVFGSLFGFLIMGVICPVCLYPAMKEYWKSPQPWLEKVNRAKSDVMEDLTPSNTNNGSIVFKSATFMATYNDSSHNNGQQVVETTGSMFLDKAEDGDTSCSQVGGNESHQLGADTLRSITGSGKDEDGGFIIKEGAISLSSGKCYWVEESDSYPNRQVLIQGTICFGQDTGSMSMEGQWEADNGAYGSFQFFEIVPCEFEGITLDEECLMLESPGTMTNHTSGRVFPASGCRHGNKWREM